MKKTTKILLITLVMTLTILNTLVILNFFFQDNNINIEVKNLKKASININPEPTPVITITQTIHQTTTFQKKYANQTLHAANNAVFRQNK